MANARGRRGGGRGALIPNKRRSTAEIAADRAARFARRSILPSPKSKSGQRRIARLKLPDTEEVKFLRRAALSEVLGGGPGPYSAELKKLAAGTYGAAYAGQRKSRPARPKKKSATVRVKAHTRRRPGGRR